jgi:hypothetical protein
MRKQEIWDAAHEVAIHTRTVEGLIETTLVELAALQSKLVRVSDVAGVSYSTLQQSFEGVAATINELVKVRGTMADCHRQFVEAKEDIPGLRTVAWGDGSPCKCAIARTDLRVVA